MREQNMQSELLHHVEWRLGDELGCLGEELGSSSEEPGFERARARSALLNFQQCTKDNTAINTSTSLQVAVLNKITTPSGS